jgi:Protein of unknown function (DUF4199)
MFKIAVKTGIICGLILIVPIIIQIIIGVDKIWINGFVSLGLLALTIWLIIKAVKEYRSECDNRITFGNAFNIALTSFLIVSLLTVGFSYIHQNYIDPGYGQKSKDMMMQKAEEKINSNPSLTEDQKTMFMERFENEDPSFTVKKALKTLGYGIGLYLVISLIIAASVKKDLNETPEV